MTYEEALAAIHGLEGRPWRSGLDRMQAFVEAAGLRRALAERNYIHIAGTNGKGTTTAFVESILRAQGWRTGAFFSPYVVDYRERIQARGRLIEPDEIASLVERLLPIADSLGDTPYAGATKFEFEFAMGLAHWEQSGIEWVALETGLGGRLDATNVVSPLACVIVSIGLDHTAILGETFEKIAAEKSGIIKPGIPVIVGDLPPSAFEIVKHVAEDRGAPLWRYGIEVLATARGDWTDVATPGGTFVGLQPAPLGAYSVHNAALAVAACVAAGAVHDVTSVVRGVAEAWLPGRFERRRIQGREVVLDGAHNSEAARALVRSLGSRIVLVTNMVSGHEVEGFYREFIDRAVRAEVAPIASPRALRVTDAVTRIEDVGISARGHDTVQAALDAAIDGEPDETVVVTGSNYLVGEALRLLS